MDLCRRKGVISFKGTVLGYEHIEMLFGPPPAPEKPAKKEEPGVSAREAKRAHYMNLLGRPFTDAELDMLPDA